MDKELAICLMDKGVIYDSERSFNHECSTYRKTIAIFRAIDDLINKIKGEK